MSVPESGTGSHNWWQPPRQIYIKCSSDLVPCAEAMGYTMGKTLGSGTYAKVKAAWSPYEGRMVSNKIWGRGSLTNTHVNNSRCRNVIIILFVDGHKELEQEASIR